MIDVFHRIRALHNLGVDIHLHCFQYGRSEQEELKKYCSQVNYYKRHTGLLSAFSRKPYIVKSRQSRQLVERLKADEAPILVEGLHCCSLLEELDGQRIIVRAHNVEHDYYNNLAAALENEKGIKNIFRRIYLRSDTRRLRRYEPILLKARAILAITETDASHFRAIGCRNVLHIPAFHPFDDVISTPTPSCKPEHGNTQGNKENKPCFSRDTSSGNFALYHGDLSVAENIEAVMTLADNIFSRSPHSFVVAGRNPSVQLCKRLSSCPNVTLIANPSDSQMRQLLADAQVQILITSSPTGLKLKLVNSLFSGRHLLVNSDMVAGTELAPLCHVADKPSQQLELLNKLMQTPFTNDDITHRRAMLSPRYINRSNAQKLIAELKRLFPNFSI